MRGDNTARKVKPYSLKYTGKYWQANIKLPDGKWSTKNVPSILGYNVSQEILAEAWIVNYLDNIYSGQSQNIVVQPKKTIAMLLNRWLEYRKNLNTTKLTTYQGLVSAGLHLVDSNIYHLDIETELNVAAAKTFYDNLNVAVSSKTTVIWHISGMLRDFAINEWISEDYISVFKRPGFLAHMRSAVAGEKDKEIIVVPHEILSKLLAHERKHYKLLYAIGYYTGMRRSEIQGLSWEDIDFEKQIIHVRKQLLQPGEAPYVHAKGMSKNEVMLSQSAVMAPPKYNSYRTLPIHPRLLDMLQVAFGARAANGTDPVCPSSKNRYGRALRAMAELTRLGLSMHALRRTIATDLGRAGVSDEHVAHILGHRAKNKTLRRHYVKSEVEIYRLDINTLPNL